MGYELVLYTGVVEEEVPPSEEQVKKAEKKRRKIRSQLSAVRHQTDQKKAEIAKAAARIQQMDSELQAEHQDLSTKYLEAQDLLERLQNEVAERERKRREEEVIIDEEKDDPLEDFEALEVEIEEVIEDEDDDHDEQHEPDPELRKLNRAERRKKKKEDEEGRRLKRIKDLWRKISMKTHPDRIKGENKEKLEIYLKAKKAYERKDLDTLERLYGELMITASALLGQLLEQLAMAERELLMTVAMMANLRNNEQYVMMTDWFGGAKMGVSQHFRRMLQGRLQQLYESIDRLKPPVTVDEGHTVNNDDDDNELRTTPWHFEG